MPETGHDEAMEYESKPRYLLTPEERAHLAVRERAAKSRARKLGIEYSVTRGTNRAYKLLSTRPDRPRNGWLTFPGTGGHTIETISEVEAVLDEVESRDHS